MTRGKVLCAVLAVIVYLASPASGGTKTWIDGTGQWDTSGNWSPGGQPQAGDDALLTQTDATNRIVTYYNTSNPTALLKSLKIDATGTGTMTLDMPNNHGLKVTTEYVGYDGKGIVTQSTGTNNAATLYLGYNTGGNGTYTLTGGTLSSSSKQYIGYSGTGKMSIQNGVQVSNVTGYLGYNSGSTGTATVTGADSKWTNSSVLYVGSDGNGTLNIEAGGQVSNASGYLGYNFGSGTATVTGTDSKWTNSSDLSVGRSGSGTLKIEAGGLVSDATGYLGYDSGSTGAATVTGVGSKWTNTGSGYPNGLYVGYSGSGTLTIQDNGEVTSDGYASYLGYSSGAGGTAAVSGVGSKWTNAGYLFVGEGGTGTLTVKDGGNVSDASAYVGAGSDSHGIATVTGPGSTWTNSGSLTVGNNSALVNSGAGKVTVEAGGLLVSNCAWVGRGRTPDGANGTVAVTGSSSSWNNSGFLIVGDGGAGALTIRDGAVVTNTWGNVGFHPQGDGFVTVNGAGSLWANNGKLDVGFDGAGVMMVEGGGAVSNVNGYIGTNAGARGKVVVTGTGSTWTNAGVLQVGAGSYSGWAGSSTLIVEKGGKVLSSGGYIGMGGGFIGVASRCAATVTGAGSAWLNSGFLTLGKSSSASDTYKLAVADGGLVTATSLSISGQSAVKVSVAGNSAIVLGDGSTNGSLTNNGKVNLYADSFVAAGTYLPIAPYTGKTITWSGSGTYSGVGGEWKAGSKSLDVAPATGLAGGVTDDVSSFERLLFTESASGRRVGASFGDVTGSPTFSAALASAAELDALTLTAGFDDEVLSAWDFSTTLAGGTEVLLSFDIGLGKDDLDIWHYTSGAWQQYAPDLMTYDSGGILSFTVTNFSGYAVTGVPEPGSAILLLLGAAALLRRKRGYGG